VQLGVEIRHAGSECFVFFRFPEDADGFIFVDVNETLTLDDRDKIVLFLA